MTFITACTAKGEKSYAEEDRTFELKDVLTHSIRVLVFVI